MCLVFCDALDPVHTLLLRVLSLNLVHQNSMNFVVHISSRLYDSRTNILKVPTLSYAHNDTPSAAATQVKSGVLWITIFPYSNRTILSLEKKILSLRTF